MQRTEFLWCSLRSKMQLWKPWNLALYGGAWNNAQTFSIKALGISNVTFGLILVTCCYRGCPLSPAPPLSLPSPPSFPSLSLPSTPPPLSPSTPSPSSTPPVFSPLKERLGDAKDGVRDQSQLLIQQLMREAVSSPQTFLERLMEACLSHKNWRVKEQGLVCLARTLN